MKCSFLYKQKSLLVLFFFAGFVMFTLFSFCLVFSSVYFVIFSLFSSVFTVFLQKDILNLSSLIFCMDEFTSNLFFGFVKGAFKCSLVVSAFYAGMTYHTAFSRLERNTLYRNLHMEEGYFRDPEGLEIIIKMNDHGNLVPFLYHKESALRLPLSNEVLEKYGEIKQMVR